MRTLSGEPIVQYCSSAPVPMGGINSRGSHEGHSWDNIVSDSAAALAGAVRPASALRLRRSWECVRKPIAPRSANNNTQINEPSVAGRTLTPLEAVGTVQLTISFAKSPSESKQTALE